MPNLKIYVDEIVGTEKQTRLSAALPSLRDLLCRQLEVDVSLCQLAIVPVQGLRDQAQLAIEIVLLPKPARTRERIASTCAALRDALIEITEIKAAVRVTTVDPQNHFALRSDD